MDLYIVAGILVVLLSAATAAAFVLGLLGEMGVIRLARCEQCDHLVLARREDGALRCPYCRHERLAHPWQALRHPGRRVAHR